MSLCSLQWRPEAYSEFRGGKFEGGLNEKCSNYDCGLFLSFENQGTEF